MLDRGPFHGDIPSAVHMSARDNTGEALSAPTEQARLLVVEDEQKVANALRDGLHGEG